MTITAPMVKELREKTGVGMMDCKKALDETKGDFEKAVKYLREKGLASAAKKSDRSTKEGRTFIAINSGKAQGLVLEINCETDFVSKNAVFQAFGNQVAQAALAKNVQSSDQLEQLMIDGHPLKEAVASVIAKIGENITIGNVKSASGTALAGYIHQTGKIGVLVAFSADVAEEVGKDVAMHVAASNPQYVKADEVTQEELDKEKEIIAVQARNEGRPEPVIEKIVVGRLEKYKGEVCLLEQPFVKEPKQKVKQILPASATVTSFIRFSI